MDAEVSELTRMKVHNLRLMRQLSKARRDALLYAAQFCEDHAVTSGPSEVSLGPVRLNWPHAGHVYAKALREIAK